MAKPILKSTIIIAKRSAKKLDAGKMRKQITHIEGRILDGGRADKGWSVKSVANGWQPIVDEDTGEYVYSVDLNLLCKPARQRDEKTVQNEFLNIQLVAAAAGNTHHWKIVSVDGKERSEEEEETVIRTVQYANVVIPGNWAECFTGVYEREDQISIILSSIEAGIRSNWQDRFHIALVGLPACGKTEILRCVKRMVGEEAVLEYDATATTQAGAIKDLNQRDIMPRIMILEEAEKTDENSLRWLLASLDHRAEIRKVNFKVNIQKETRFLCLATVNDYESFCRIMSGALASRFPLHLECKPPSRPLLERILTREIERAKGKKTWIKPTLDFADKHRIHDPRRVCAICLCGGDDLLGAGAYQKKLEAVHADLKPKV